jgi:hypothetical protein
MKRISIRINLQQICVICMRGQSIIPDGRYWKYSYYYYYKRGHGIKAEVVITDVSNDNEQ